MVEPERPGDIRRLTEGALAADGQWVALAALARQSQAGSTALRTLSQAAEDEDAFAWTWGLLAASDHHWTAVDFPPQVTVPAWLHDAVVQFIVEAPGSTQGRTTPHERLALALMTSLGATAVGRAAATAALSTPGSASPELRTAAAALLGATDDPAGRALARQWINDQPDGKRAGAFSLLQTPFDEDELAEVIAALEFFRDRPHDEKDLTAAAATAARLPAAILAQYLAGSWPRPENRAKVVSALIGRLDGGGVDALLDALIDTDVHDIVATTACQRLGDGDALALGERLARQGRTDLTSPVWERVAQKLKFAKRPGSGRRDLILAGLWRLHLAGPESDRAEEVAAVLRAGELSSAASDHPEDSGTALGQVAGHLLGQDSSWAGEVSEAAALLHPECSDDYWQALADNLLLSGGSLPEQVRDTALQAPNGAIALAGAGFSEPLLEAADTPQRAANLVVAAAPALGDPELAQLLAAASWHLAGEIPYLRALEAVNHRPDVLGRELDRAVAALAGPDADAPGPAVLTALLQHAATNGTHHGNDDADDSSSGVRTLETLLEYPDDAVVHGACQWARTLDLREGSATCSNQRSQVVIGADDRRGHRSQALVHLRADLGIKLAELARNSAADPGERAQHLSVAVAANPSAARNAALQIMTSHNNDLRLAAAHALASTSGQPDDADAIASLIDAEPREDIRAALKTALHRVSSGSIGRALLGLAEILGLDPDPKVYNPDKLIPDTAMHDRFVHSIDTARARADNSHDPGTFIDAAIIIADQMVDIAVLADHQAGRPGSINDKQRDLIASNTHGRPDTGQLLGRQQLQQLHPWFHHAQSLRSKRGAHPSEIGSLKPRTLDASDLITARNLLRDITAGWAVDMHTT